jgi:VanZ family protein
MKTWIGRFGPALIIMFIIFMASGTQGSDLPTFGIWDIFAKKGGHVLGYALLAASYYHALSYNKKFSHIDFFIAFFLTVLYAMTDEWHQRFIPGRTPSIEDVCIDAIGGFISLALWSLIRLRSLNGDKRAES